VRIANADGSLAERLDYMAFGGRRSPSDPHAAGTASANTPRGYTGHEYVDGTGVIHMNGRIYDSELGRFLQADPVIQAPNNTQSWNAYTYVFNNPFAYTDPTGMISFRQLFAVVFAAVYAYFTWDLTGASAIYAAMIGGAITGAIATGTWKGAIMGAFTGAVTAGIGWAAHTYEWANIARVAAQAVSGGVMESLQGGNFGNGFFAAGLTATVTPNLRGIKNDFARVAAGALVGGTISKATGGKFANGVISGAIQAALSPRRENVRSANLEGNSEVPPDAYIDNPDKAKEAMAKADTAVLKSGIWDRRYTSEQDLARDWGKAVYPVSAEVGVEIGAKIFKIGKYYVVGKSYSSGALGRVYGINLASGLKHGALSAYIHTHPNVSWGTPSFSRGDLWTSWDAGVNAYVYSQNYQLQWNYNEWARMPLTNIANSYVPFEDAVKDL